MRRCRRGHSHAAAPRARRPGGGSWRRARRSSSRSPRRSRSGGRRRARPARRSYRVLGDLAGIRLDLGDADVEIDGGATAVEVRRVDRFAYGAPSKERRSVDGRHAEHQLALPGPGPRLLPRLLPARGARQRPARDPDRRAAPSASPACARRCTINTGSGAIAVSGFCGFLLRASSDSGDVRALSECSADRLELRSRARRRARRRARPAATRSTPRATRARSASAGSPTPPTRRSRSRR